MNTLNIINVLLLVACAIGMGVFIGMKISEKQLNKYHTENYDYLLKDYNEISNLYQKTSNKLAVVEFIEWRKKDGIVLTYDEAREYLISIGNIRVK